MRRSVSRRVGQVPSPTPIGRHVGDSTSVTSSARHFGRWSAASRPAVSQPAVPPPTTTTRLTCSVTFGGFHGDCPQSYTQTKKPLGQRLFSPAAAFAPGSRSRFSPCYLPSVYRAPIM